MKTLLDHKQLNITLQRLAHQLVENHLSFRDTAIIGLQPRGVWLSDRIAQLVRGIVGNQHINYGRLDITFSVQDKNVILIDDVLHTGRTIRAAMDALIDFGRPANVELMVLIDRHFSRELPIQPDYVGQTVDTIITQKVKVYWQEKDNKDEVVLID